MANENVRLHCPGEAKCEIILPLTIHLEAAEPDSHTAFRDKARHRPTAWNQNTVDQQEHKRVQTSRTGFKHVIAEKQKEQVGKCLKDSGVNDLVIKEVELQQHYIS